MPQPIAPSTIRKQMPPAMRPTGLPAYSLSEEPPAVASPAVVVPPPPSARARRPIANKAGSPAPAIRPSTTICQSAEKLIQGGTGVAGAAAASMWCMGYLAGSRRGPGQAAAGAGVAAAGSEGATPPVHSELTLLWSTLVLRDRQ